MIKVKNRHIKCPSKTFYLIHYPEWLRESKYIQSIQHAHPWKIIEVAMFQHKCLYFMLNSLLQWDSVNFLMLIKACCCYLKKDAVWIRYTVCKISRNHGWSNGPMVTLWVVRWRYKLILSYCIIDIWISGCISFVDYTLLCWKQNKSIMENCDIILWQKSWSPNGPPRWTSRSPGRFIGRLGRPVVLHTGYKKLSTKENSIWFSTDNGLVLNGTKTPPELIGPVPVEELTLLPWVWIITCPNDFKLISGAKFSHFDVIKNSLMISMTTVGAWLSV